MAFVTDYNFVLDKMQVEKLPYYAVLDSDGKTTLDENQDPELGVDMAVKQLTNTLENLTGLVTITLSPYTKKQKGEGLSIQRNLRFTTRLPDKAAVSGIGAISHTPAANYNDIEDRIRREYEAKFEAQKREFDLMRRIEKLEEEKSESLEQSELTKMVIGMIPSLMGGTMPVGSPNINGLPENNIHQRINAAIKILYANDKNFIENLEKLATIAQNNPLIYQIAISKLKEL